jgi:hypothetical protein
LLPVRSLDGCFEVRPEARLLSLVPSSRLKRFDRRRLEEAYTSKRLIPLAPKNFTETSSVSIC